MSISVHIHYNLNIIYKRHSPIEHLITPELYGVNLINCIKMKNFPQSFTKLILSKNSSKNVIFKLLN